MIGCIFNIKLKKINLNPFNHLNKPNNSAIFPLFSKTLLQPTKRPDKAKSNNALKAKLFLSHIMSKTSQNNLNNRNFLNMS